MVNLQVICIVKKEHWTLSFQVLPAYLLVALWLLGAHGSSVKNVSTLADIVQSLDVIYEKNGQSIEERISPSSPYFKAWLSNLGSLGVVKHVYLKTMDQYVLESRVRLHKEEDIYTQDGIDKILNDCDFAQMVWLPGLRTIPAVERNVISFCGKKARYDESKKYAGRISLLIARSPINCLKCLKL